MWKRITISKILLYETLGFLAIVGLPWLDTLLAVPALILHHQRLPIERLASDYPIVVTKMLIVLAVWYLVTCATRRLLLRMHYLESFMRVCSWCHHIHFKGEWIELEKFLQKGLDTPTTHGICPACLKQQKAVLELAQRPVGRPAGPSNQ